MNVKISWINANKTENAFQFMTASFGYYGNSFALSTYVRIARKGRYGQEL